LSRLARPPELNRYAAELLPPSVVYIDVKRADRLRTISVVDIYFARLVAASAAIIQLWDHGARLYWLQQFFAQGGEALIDQTYMLMHLRIAVALLAAAISLWFRKTFAFCLSIFCAVWVLLEYWLWHLRSQRMLLYAEVPRWPEGTPHAFELAGATAWNAAVLLLTLLLVLWQMKTLFGGTRLFRRAAV
jgi:hypothetical protein